MTSPTFDPCKQWLGIDAVDLGDPRRVLGLPAGQLDSQTIIRAATNKLSLLQSVQPGAFAMAHAALIRRVTESRDALLAESVASAPVRFSMPPPPPGVAAMAPPPVPPAFTMPPVPPVPPVAPTVSTSPAVSAADEPVIALRTRTVPNHRPKSAAGPVVMLAVAALSAVVAIMGYQAYLQRLAPPKNKNREVATIEREPEPPVARPNEPDMADPPRSDDPVATPPTSRPRPAPPSEPEPEPEPEPGPAATAAPDPKPAAAEMTTPAPEPPKPPPAPPTPSDDESMRKVVALLQEAFRAMQRQDFQESTRALEAARKAAADEAMLERVTSFEELGSCAEKFSEFREQALADLRPGMEYEVPTAKSARRIAIVEVNDDEIVYREAGRNDRWPRDKIPAAVLTHIVREWFDGRPDNHLFLGAYFATKPEPDLANARAAWSTARDRGADAAGLLPLLEDPLLTAE
jgi:hypothetical protein